ncbi:hypothetical protein [Deinococcus yavapaiensis]|uniref:Uncharacterized protein n=1 Tax=Deinococcus yavapaiensis KR-236 TaxID=694435 RepID=A0A318S5P7_9DEIO|nr:hypothetical protein [Deinococcus yavapaiensis]PYE53885.1 hypothetical protein DES52_107143 [Deinococcus yavapaiensis KR-236]
MDALITLTLYVLGWLLYGLWKLLGNFFGLGATCVLVALYGLGSDWPLAGVIPIAVVALGAWSVSLHGGLRSWREARAARELRG